MRWLHAARVRLSLLFGRRAAESRIDEEFRFHLDMETERLVREMGLEPAEATRRANAVFGGATQHREALREGRGFAWLGRFALDFKLGARLLVKHPGLTVISTIAVGYAIAVGTVGFEVARQALWPTIPLPDGNEIVALRNWDVAENTPVPASRRDYERWRDDIDALSDLSAIEVEERSIAVGDGPGQPEVVANVTASTFALTRVPALMGRTLLEADEPGGAEEVVVIGYDFWQGRMNGAIDAVGRVIRISGTPVTVVGVMPRGYGFPQRNDIWRPLHLERIPEASPSISYVLGRLAPSHSREAATAQAAAIGARSTTMFPETHGNVRLQLRSLPDDVSYWSDRATMVLATINVFVVLLAALLCGNVAMLLFARAVSREPELLVRAALGASRRRLVLQLFAEALLLCAVGAIAGLLVARYVLARAWVMLEEATGPLPFWIDTSISSTTILYAAGLTLFAAAIAGVIPALKVTSGGAGLRLRAASGGGGGLRFGGVWTAVIVAQIAVTTMLPVPLLGVGSDFARETPAGFPAEAYLTATLAMDRLEGEAAPGDTVAGERSDRLQERYLALAERLRAEPGVVDLTWADQMPLMRTRWRVIEMNPGPVAEQTERCRSCAGVVSTDPRFFDVVGAPVISGRALTTADAENGTRAVLVNEFFVEHVMGGYNPIGRQVRFPSAREGIPEPWYEIVGVVPDLGVSDNASDYGRPRIYQATPPGEAGPLRIAIHVRGDPQAFSVRLRELAQAVDPALRVIDPKPMPSLLDSVSGFWMALLVSFTILTLMLSLAGIYAVTAFAVARRTREIGVRVALGAQPLHVLTAIFRRPLVQIAMGIGAGVTLALGIANDDLSELHLDDVASAAALALATVLCCAIACIVPTRRALRIPPTEALREAG